MEIKREHTVTTISWMKSTFWRKKNHSHVKSCILFFIIKVAFMVRFVQADLMDCHLILNLHLHFWSFGAKILKSKLNVFKIVTVFHFFKWCTTQYPRVPLMIVPWGTALCSTILRPPEVKSCRIIWWPFKESILLQTIVIYLILSTSKDF